MARSSATFKDTKDAGMVVFTICSINLPIGPSKETNGSWKMIVYCKLKQTVLLIASIILGMVNVFARADRHGFRFVIHGHRLDKSIILYSNQKLVSVRNSLYLHRVGNNTYL